MSPSAVDIIIRGGLVVDGSGTPGVEADVSISDGRIVEVGTVNARASRSIDASGLVVTPGFIDVKTHSDWTLPLMPYAESKVRQGVTTEVVGHCGYSCAPALEGKVQDLRIYLGPSAPWLEFSAGDFASYLAAYPSTSVNRVMLVGHNTLRLMVMGLDDRPARPRELEMMAGMLERSLSSGAFGLSTGLFTAPGCYATSDELKALGQVLRRHRAPYFTHLRDESYDIVGSVREAIEFASFSGVHVQISHMKLSGIDNWGRAPLILEMLKDARSSGVSIDCDAYPYTVASNPLKNLFPAWLQESGVDAMIERAQSQEVRGRLRQHLDDHGLNNFGRVESWDSVCVSVSPNRSELEGLTIGEIARRRGLDPFDVALDYLVEDKGMTRVLVNSMSEEDVQAFVASPEVLVGSDGNAIATKGVTSRGRPHPRAYGTFARVLGRYVRDLGLLSLPEAIRKMSGATATALGIPDRGFLRPGFRADIAAFDPTSIADRSTYADPHQYAIGVAYVIVNGRLVIDAGRHTGLRPGSLIRRAGLSMSRR